ncbi:MAG: zinc ribbon domain-containing protein [Clostridiales bacterium]|nr:zinc ribbon domain-containing protein [Clostridiales bacterium]
MPSSYYYETTIPIFGFLRAFYGYGLVLSIITVAALWILFQKAGEEGWAAVIPFYNLYILYKITWGNGWNFLLLLIPIANIVIQIITMVKLARVFGKGGGWACGLIFLYPIFLCIMAFDKSIVYVGDYPGEGFYARAEQQGYANSTWQQTAQDAPKFCSKCGNPVNKGDKFCLNCGHPL